MLVSGSLGSWFNGCLLDAIYQTLHDRRQEMLIYRTLDSGQRDEFFTTLPARRNADALIVASLELTSDQRQRLQRLDLPVVFVNQRGLGRSVGVDRRRGRSHRRHAAPDQPRAPPDRVCGLGIRRRRAAELVEPAVRVPGGAGGGRGAERDQMVISVHGREAAEHAVAQLLSFSEPPTAVLVESDDLAMRVLAELWRVGIRTPRTCR